MYLAKILNVLIQFASYLLLADPVFFSSSSNKFFGFETGEKRQTSKQWGDTHLTQPFLPLASFVAGNENLARATIRTNVEVQFTPETFNCRLDQVAAGLLQLLTVDFVVSKVIASVLPYANMAKAKILKGTFKKEEVRMDWYGVRVMITSTTPLTANATLRSSRSSLWRRKW